MNVRSRLLFSVLLLGLAAPSGAVVLTTPVVGASAQEQVVCYLTNIDTKPVTITATKLIDFGGNAAVQNSNSCTGTLPPGASCFLGANKGVSVYCSFSVNGSKVRAAGIVGNASSPFEIHAEVPATK